jgi:hypothetical protein
LIIGDHDRANVIRDQNFGDFSQCPMRLGRDDVSALGGENTRDCHFCLPEMVLRSTFDRLCLTAVCSACRVRSPDRDKSKNSAVGYATASAPKSVATLGGVADARSDQISRRAPVAAWFSAGDTEPIIDTFLHRLDLFRRILPRRDVIAHEAIGDEVLPRRAFAPGCHTPIVIPYFRGEDFEGDGHHLIAFP